MTMNQWYQSIYQMFEVLSDFIEAWLCYGFVGLFLPDRVRGKVPFFILSLILVGSVRTMDGLGMDPMISTLWFVFFICMTTVVLFQVNLFYAVSLVSFYILCLIMVLCFIFLLLLYSNYMKEHELRSILELKDQMVRQEYEMVKQLQTEQQSLSHDMKNHLLVMDTMLKEGKYQEAQQYISQLGIPLERLSPSIWTGASTLDVLLNHTRNRCSQFHIGFTVQADAVDLRPMKDQDICSLFANLLDNAFEAARQVPEGQGWILFKMRKAKEMLFIDLSNPAAAPPRVRNGALVSRKQDGQLHGLGLNRAAATAREYGGQLTYEYKDGVFTAAVIFLGGIKGNATKK